MDVLNLVLNLLQNLAVISRDPALGVRDSAITSVLTLVALAKGGVNGLKALREMSDRVGIMVREGREPTQEEWAELRKRSDEAHAIIQSFDTEEPMSDVPVPEVAPNA